MKKNILAIRAFPPDLHKQAKLLAIQQGISLRDFVIAAVAAKVKGE